MAGGQMKDAAAAAAAPGPRVVPGAGHLAASKNSKKPAAAAKKDAATSPATNGSAQPKSNMDKAAHASALTAQAPTAGQVDANLKVRPADVAEEAERQAAFAAVEIVQQKEQKENGINGHAVTAESDNAKGALQAILAKRIKVLNKKLQRAVQYEALDQTKVNEDQRRIVASRPGLEGSVHELTEMAKALEIAEGEAQRTAKIHEGQQIAAAVQKTKEEGSKLTSTLLQLMQLHSLVSPSAQSSFAPKPMPPVLNTATGQDIAAASKLYADLAASNEVTPLDSKMTSIDKLARGSADEIFEDVSFQRVLELLEGLDAPVTQQVPPTETVPETAPASTEAAPELEPEPQVAAPQISFLQASELEEAQAASAEAPAEPQQAEPEGGAVDSVPTTAIEGGATDKGQAGASGTVLGQDVAEATSALAPQADGTAQAEVDEPVQTTEVSSMDSAVPTPKVIDWAADDDADFGDLEIQPNGVAGATAVPKRGAAATEAAAPSTDAANKTKTETRGQRTEKQRRPSGAAQQRENSGRPPRSRNPTTQPQQSAKPPAPVKTGPEVDEDGFTVASSKRTKFLQEKQQQQAARGGRSAGGRGGRGNGAGANAAGRGRGNGTRGGRPPAAAGQSGADATTA